MPLQLPKGTRFAEAGAEEPLPREFVSEVEDLVGKIVAQGLRRQELLEYFKGFFAAALGAAHGWSSSESWAYTDLQMYMQDAARSPALFVEALYDGCEALREDGIYELPDVALINNLLQKHGVPLAIRPPRLVRLSTAASVEAPEPPPTLAESAAVVVRQSLQRAEELLAEKRSREAVQEMLWILESIATAFRDVPLPSGSIQGRYFNEIARELRKAMPGTTMEQVVRWSTQLQGYLSSPTGGGVRHGIDLRAGQPVSEDEARLFCNLILSYVTYLMAEHARLAQGTEAV